MRLVERCVILMLGFIVVSFGLTLMLQSTLGMGAWGAFQVSVAQLSGLSIGRVTQLCSVVALLLAWLLGVAPTIASFLNMVAIGFFMDIFLTILPTSETLVTHILFFTTGLFFFCFGVAVYLKAGLGSGPRESLMLAIHQRFRTSIRTSRIFVDGTMLVASVLLRGPIGLGTIVHTISCGPLIQFFMDLLSVDSRQIEPASF